MSLLGKGLYSRNTRSRNPVNPKSDLRTGKSLWFSVASEARSFPILLLKQFPYSRLYRKASRRVLSISREDDSTTSLGSWIQCSVTLTVDFLCSDGTPCVSACAYCPLTSHWALLKRAYTHPLNSHSGCS